MSVHRQQLTHHRDQHLHLHRLPSHRPRPRLRPRSSVYTNQQRFNRWFSEVSPTGSYLMYCNPTCKIGMRNDATSAGHLSTNASSAWIGMSSSKTKGLEHGTNLQTTLSQLFIVALHCFQDRRDNVTQKKARFVAESGAPRPLSTERRSAGGRPT